MIINPITIMDPKTYINTPKIDIPKQYIEYIKYVMISNKQIIDRLKQISEEIHKEYQGKDLHILCTLKGAEKTFSEIITNLNELNIHTEKNVGITFNFIRASSYTNTLSTGEVKINSEGLENITNKNILIVEDIIDTGKTITALINAINQYDPQSVKVVSLLIKEMKNDFRPDYTGFSIPEEFVVGFGLDYNERFRELSDICILNSKGIDKYKK